MTERSQPKDLTLLAGVGYEKCGTTTLARNLGRVAGFCVPRKKELSFFNKRYSDSLGVYLRYFPVNSHSEFLVDVSPTYIRSQEALQRLKRMNINKKIVVCMRDPIQRAYSHYVHNIFSHHAHYDPALKQY